MSRKMKRYSRKTIIILILIIISLFCVFPFFWMLVTSVKMKSELFQYPPSLWPSEWHWENYKTVWTSVPFGRFYINSIICAVCITVGQLTTCSLGAYAFARLNFRGRDKLFLLYLATLMIPFQVIMIPLYSIIVKLNWIDTYQGIIVPSLFSAYGTFLLRQFFMGVPKELEESVKIDGGGYLVCFFRIMLPLSKAALATLGIFVFLFSWNNFLWPLLVVNTIPMHTLPLGITLFQSRSTTDWNLIMGASCIAMMPLLTVFLFAQQYFIEGITVGAVKG